MLSRDSAHRAELWYYLFMNGDDRHPSEEVTARLTFIATLEDYLAGTYNEFGIRRWFERPRTVLQGKTPTELLQGPFDPGSPELKQLRELARSLTGIPAG